ncbi:hypothetical protein vseg_006461 [Gypsophila vaccaria]
MDINPATDNANEVSLERARELLIEISECLPDHIFSSKSTNVLPNSNVSGVAVTSEDTTEELRSELISISYVPFPENITLPALGVGKSN